MRFMVCTRDRRDGTVGLVSAASFPNRREAVEAIVASVGVGALLDTDVFLVDLEVATPVALVPVSQASDVTVSDASLVPEESSDVLPRDAAGGAQPSIEEDLAEKEPSPEHYRLVEIDIESWTCEDCIYVMTCAKSGTVRPIDCGSFQWRA
jgi:hypothetical protein